MGLRTPKIKISNEGAICVKLTNKTGGVTEAGRVVDASGANDDAFGLTGADDNHPIGIMNEDGVADGDESWVTIQGIEDVLQDDNNASTHGNWVKSGDEAGYADSTQANPPGGGVAQIDEHMQEVGHCLESVGAGGGGTHIKSRQIVHLN